MMWKKLESTQQCLEGYIYTTKTKYPTGKLHQNCSEYMDSSLMKGFISPCNFWDVAFFKVLCISALAWLRWCSTSSQCYSLVCYCTTFGHPKDLGRWCLTFKDIGVRWAQKLKLQDHKTLRSANREFGRQPSCSTWMLSSKESVWLIEGSLSSSTNVPTHQTLKVSQCMMRLQTSWTNWRSLVHRDISALLTVLPNRLSLQSCSKNRKSPLSQP